MFAYVLLALLVMILICVDSIRNKQINRNLKKHKLAKKDSKELDTGSKEKSSE